MTHYTSLASSVRAGENAGRQLRHDFVVRERIGPLPVGGGARASHVFARPDLIAANAGIAVLVESADGSRLLQAVAQPLCHDGAS